MYAMKEWRTKHRKYTNLNILKVENEAVGAAEGVGTTAAAPGGEGDTSADFM